MFNWLNDVFTGGDQLSAGQTGVAQQAVAGAGQPLSQGGIAPPISGAAQTVQPGVAATGGQQPGFWSQDGGAGMILGGVQTLGNLWNSYQSNKLAKEQMSFAREQWDTNLANQTQTYNTALEDRIRARHHTEGKGSGETDSYLNQHSL